MRCGNGRLRRLLLIRWNEACNFARNAVWAERRQKLDLFAPGILGASIGEIDDVALTRPFDGGVRLVDKTLQAFRQPMIAACLFALATHSLLNDDPAAFIGDDEAVQIKIKAVLHGGAINLGDEAAHGGEFVAIKADAISDRHKLSRRATRMIAAPAADMQTEFVAERAIRA